MSYQKAHQEPYTKYPNRYNDVIKPLLTGAQRDVCDVVIRMTWGWHRESAEISNSVFARKANKSKQGIIKAKKQLEEMGILIVLGKGGGSKINEYMLDLWYDNPDRSVKASMLRQEKQLMEMADLSTQEDKENIPELVEASITVEPQIIVEENPDCDISDPQAVGPGNHVPEQPDPAQGIPDVAEAENPIIIEDSEPPTSKLSLPPYKEDLSNNILSNKEKQTVNSEDEKTERKKATATVCFLLKSWGYELEPNDYAFVGWAIKSYGAEAANEKIQIMRFQRNRGIKFTNPLGWLRSSLSRDYGLCKWDTDVIKAKERAKKAAERSRLEQIQREREIQDMEKLRDEAEEIKTRLAPENREDLRKAAIEQLLGMDGMNEDWLNDCAIGSMENQILRERTKGVITYVSSV